MPANSISPAQQLQLASRAGAEGRWKVVLVHLFGDEGPYTPDRLPRFADLAQQRQALQLVIEALGHTNQPTALTYNIRALLRTGDFTEQDLLLALRSYARLGCVGPMDMEWQVWRKLCEDPQACYRFAECLRDEGKLRPALEFAQKARDLGAPYEAARSLIDAIWYSLPEGRMERACASAIQNQWREVLRAFFDEQVPSATRLPEYPAGEERTRALDLTAVALRETNEAGPLPEFLRALEQARGLSHAEALSYAAAIAKSSDRSSAGQLYADWCRRFPRDADLAEYRAVHLQRCGTHQEAIKEARRALALGGNEQSCRRLIVTSLKELGRLHEALVELAILHAAQELPPVDRAIYDELRDAVIPNGLHAGRETRVPVAREILETFKKTGRSFGRFFGGGDPRLPRREEVLKAAPTLVRADRVHKLLQRPDLSSTLGEYLRQRPHLSDAAVAGTVMSLNGLYWVSAVDPRVLDAVTFSSGPQPETLLGYQNATEWFGTATGESFDGHFHRLAGYVAEQQVALDTVAGGFEVSLPEASNQEGWDLLIDGMPFQVKLTTDPGLVHEHLEKYPDIPVIVNQELGDVFAGHENVIVDPGLSYEEVHQATSETLDALDGTGLFDFDLPLITIGCSMWRHGGALLGSKIDAATYGGRVLNDAAFRGGGGVLGGKVAFVAAAVIGGPLAGAVAAVVGSMLGATAGGALADQRNLPGMCEARDQVVEDLARFGDWFQGNPLRARIDALKRREEKVANWAIRARAAGFPAEIVTLYESIVRESRQRAERVQDWMRRHLKGDADARAHAGWHALNEAPYILHPETRRRLKPVEVSLERYHQIATAQR